MPHSGSRAEVFLPSLSVVIPCHNEGAAIPSVLSSLVRVRERLVKDGVVTDCQVLVVNDGSTDATAALLKEYDWVEAIHLPYCLGYGAALKTGFLNSTGDWIAFFDLDGTYDPEDLESLVKKFEAGECQIISGDRLSAGLGMPPIRSLGNIFFTNLVSLLYRQSVKDVCTGYRIFSRLQLPEIMKLPNEGLDFSLAITLWALRSRVKIQEVPIRYHPRYGRSKLNIFSDGNRFFWTILRGRYGAFSSGKQ